jgi:RNA polymerase sigma factor (sigma-70 family)
MEPNQVAVIVRRAGEGDDEAWEQLVREYSNLLWSVVRGFRLNDAQAADAVQTTWLSLLEHVEDIREPERLGGWLATTARRACLQTLRGSRREELVDCLREPSPYAPDRRPEPEEVCPARSVVRREHRTMVHRALAELPEEQRRLMNLLLSVPAPSYQEVSAKLGMPVGSIGPTRARILSKMRVFLAASGLRDAALT